MAPLDPPPQTVYEAALPPVMLVALPAVGLAWSVLLAATTWVAGSSLAPRERASLLLTNAGVGLPFCAPVLYHFMGPVAGGVAFLVGAPMLLFSACGGYALAASGGPAFPEEYTHADGGVYSGEWSGDSKSGRGVYKYQSGARYEGEWRGNLKDGRGIYYYPKGGVYEGEWSGGLPEGVGVRTFSDGRIQAGRWHKGKLTEPLELWQCASSAQVRSRCTRRPHTRPRAPDPRPGPRLAGQG